MSSISHHTILSPVFLADEEMSPISSKEHLIIDHLNGREEDRVEADVLSLQAYSHQTCIPEASLSEEGPQPKRVGTWTTKSVIINSFIMIC